MSTSQQTDTQEVWTPPKYWQDLTADEKVERLREEIKGRDRSISELRGQMHLLQEQFKSHSHNASGMTVVPPQVNQVNYGSLNAKKTDGKEYF